MAFNEANGIVPKQIVKRVKDLIDGVYSEKSGKEAERLQEQALQQARVEDMTEKDIAREIKRLEKQMLEHARNLEFEQAARVRDQALASQAAIVRRGAVGIFLRNPQGYYVSARCYPTKLMGNVIYSRQTLNNKLPSQKGSEPNHRTE